MRNYVALLRAVNVGGGNVLRMDVLATLCAAAGLAEVRTSGASGNVRFRSEDTEEAVREAIERQLLGHFGNSVGVLVRAATELAGIVACAPFADAPPDRVMVLFTDEALPAAPFAGVLGRVDEFIVLGKRELFVFYPRGMARTRLRIPAAARGTARNMRTVTRLATPV